MMKVRCMCFNEDGKHVPVAAQCQKCNVFLCEHCYANVLCPNCGNREGDKLVRQNGGAVSVPTPVNIKLVEPSIEIPPVTTPMLLPDVIPMPEGIELYPFQDKGAREILLRPHILVAHEMGLGKTIMALAAANVAQPTSILIVAPKSVTLNWEREANKFLTEEYKNKLKFLSQTFDGKPMWIEVASSALYVGIAPIVIINYEALARWLPAVLTREWGWIILDESHVIKTPNTQRSKAARTVCELRGEKIIGITGSPILNYPFELAPVIMPIVRKYPGIEKIWRFAPTREVGTFVYRYSYGKGNKFTRHADELRSKLRETIMIREVKKDVLPDLPRKRRQVIEMKLDEADVETRKLLDEEKKLWAGRNKNLDDVLDEIAQQAAAAGVNASEIAETDVDWDNLVEGLKYTKQYFFEEMSRMRHEVALAKVPYAVEHILDVLSNMNGDAKLVIFAHHHDAERLIADAIKKAGYTVRIIDGAVNSEDRDRYVYDEFQNGKLQVIIGGIKSAGQGINLTAASHAIFVESDWSPPIVTQAEDRIHRIGQVADSCLIQHFTLEDSLDTHMARTVVRKQRQIEKVLGKVEV